MKNTISNINYISYTLKENPINDSKILSFSFLDF